MGEDSQRDKLPVLKQVVGYDATVSTVLHTRKLPGVDRKSSHHEKRFCNYVKDRDVKTRLTVIISQYTQILHLCRTPETDVVRQLPLN